MPEVTADEREEATDEAPPVMVERAPPDPEVAVEAALPTAEVAVENAVPAWEVRGLIIEPWP